MAYDLLTFGEALVEVMRTGVDQPLDRPGPFEGPFPSGAPFIFTVQAARLGARAACIGSVGDDAFGRCQLDSLAADGVDTSGVRVLPGYATGVAFIAYSGDGSRDFVFHLRHDAAGQLEPDMATPRMFERLRCLHIMGSSLSIHADALALGYRALELAQAAGAAISFDPNIRPQLMSPEQAREVFQPFVDAADILMPTSEELCLLADAATPSEGAYRLLNAKPGRLIVATAGAEGCLLYSLRDGELNTRAVRAFPVNVVDPTGAGDCFDAGFLVRWLAGDSPTEAALFANACGALACTARGPMAGAMPADVVQRFIQQHTGS